VLLRASVNFPVMRGLHEMLSLQFFWQILAFRAMLLRLRGAAHGGTLSRRPSSDLGAGSQTGNVSVNVWPTRPGWFRQNDNGDA